MCDEFIHPGLVSDPRLSRRGFGLMTAAAAAGVASPALAQDTVTETDVSVKTPDGACDAVLFHPKADGAKQRWPAVLVWPDIMGLRPVFRDMGRRLAGQGYTVLVVNPFYRSARAPVIGDNFDFSNPEQRAKLTGYRGAMTNDGIDRDAVAYLAFLDAQAVTDKTKKAGVQGYCMGGALSFRTAAMAPGRIAAVGSRQSASADRQDTGRLSDLPGPQRRRAESENEGRSQGRLRRRRQDGHDRSLRRRSRLVRQGQPGL